MRYPILHAVSRAEKLGSRSRLRTIGWVEYSWFVRLILERRRFVGVISPDYRHWLLIDEDRLANSIYSVLVIDRMVFRKAAINQIWHQQSISLSLCRVMPQHTTAEPGANQDPWRSSAKNGPACGMDNRISLCTEKKNTDIPEPRMLD